MPIAARHAPRKIVPAELAPGELGLEPRSGVPAAGVGGGSCVRVPEPGDDPVADQVQDERHHEQDERHREQRLELDRVLGRVAAR